MGFVPFELAIPGAAPVESAKPVRGPTLMGIVGALHCLAGYRGRGWHPYVPTVRRSLIADTGLAFGLADRSEEHEVWMQLSPFTTRLELVAVVSSHVSGGTTAPYVEVAAYDTGGNIDIGIRWGRDEGTLPGRDARSAADLATFAIIPRAYPQVIQTGGVIGDHFAGGASASHPRMLYVADAAGARCKLGIVTFGAQLHSLTAIEHVEASL